MGKINGREPSGVGGWLLVLCGLLLVWGPLNLGLAASSALAALPVRGLPLGLILIARVVVTGFGIAGGLALVAGRDSAVVLALSALTLSGVMDLVIYGTPYFPNNRMPGDTPLYVAASLAYHGIWIAYLLKSKRVRNTYGWKRGDDGQDGSGL